MFAKASADEKFDDVATLTKAYHKYKRDYVKHISFDPVAENLSKRIYIYRYIFSTDSTLISAITLEHAPLEAMYLYFDTATYDKIGRDEKVTLKSF